MKNLLQKKVGKRIKEIRIEKNISQQDLADLCGIEPSNMSRLEAGRANATLSTLEIVSKNLEIVVVAVWDISPWPDNLIKKIDKNNMYMMTEENEYFEDDMIVEFKYIEIWFRKR